MVLISLSTCPKIIYEILRAVLGNRTPGRSLFSLWLDSQGGRGQHRTGTHRCPTCQGVLASSWECRMDDGQKEGASPARGQSPGGVCCRTKDRNSYSACCSEILLSFTALVRPDCKKEPSHKSETPCHRHCQECSSSQVNV